MMGSRTYRRTAEGGKAVDCKSWQNIDANSNWAAHRANIWTMKECFGGKAGQGDGATGETDKKGKEEMEE